MLPGYHRDRIISLLRGVILLVLVLPSSNAKAQVNFRAVRGYLVVVPAYVNGLGPFDFLVDTGTNTTLIDPGLAQQMGGKPVGSQLLRTLTGSETVLRYSLGSLTVGLHSVFGLSALAQDMKTVQGVDPRIRGVLGLDFLLEFGFLLDYGHQQIELYDLGSAPDFAKGTRLPIQVVSGRILVSATSDSSVSGSWSLAVDSGIPKMAIFEDRIRELLASPRDESDKIRVTTNLSSLSTRVVSVRHLALANLQLRDVEVVVLPPSPGIQRGIEDGLLPASFFRWILVNARRGYAILDLDHKGRFQNLGTGRSRMPVKRTQ